MIRSINIGKTDQLVWNTIKGVLQQIRDRSHIACGPVDPNHQQYVDRDEVLTDGITWMSPERIDLLSDDEKKVVINKMITRITASFDRETNKHQINVTFSESVARSLASTAGDLRSLEESEDPSGNDSAVLCDCGEDAAGECAAKKSGGSRITSAAEIDYSVTVE